MFFGLAICEPLVMLGGPAGKSYWLYVFVRFISCIFMVFAWVSLHSLQVKKQ